jgi:hypothetical protein
LTRRDANATPPFDMLDFSSPPRLDVPDLPIPKVEPNRHKHCEEVINRAAAAGQVDIMKHRRK